MPFVDDLVMSIEQGPAKLSHFTYNISFASETYEPSSISKPSEDEQPGPVSSEFDQPLAHKL